METVRVKKISAGTVFKLIATGLTFGFLPLFILFSVMGAFGVEVLTWNEEPVIGVKAIGATDGLIHVSNVHVSHR